MLTRNLAKLVTTLLDKPFKKWGFDFIKHVKPISRLPSNQYILVTTNYVMKWVEARIICTNIVAIMAKFCMNTSL
jgi:hypothetical protein